MPDNDILNRHVVGRWCTPYRILIGDPSASEAGAAAVHALAADIRRGGGLPCLPELTAIIEGVDAGRLPVDDALRRLSDIERRMHGTLFSRVAVRTTARLLMEIAHGDVPSVPYAEAVAGRFCRELMECRLLVHLRDDLATVAGLTDKEIEACERRLIAATKDRIEILASRLVNAPDSPIRAPHSKRTTRRTIDQLLDEPIPL